MNGGLLRVRLLDPVTTDAVVRRRRAKAGCPPTATSPCRCVRVPAAERETGGVAISVLGAGEIEKHQMRGPRARRRLRPRRRRRRARIAVDGGVPPPAGRAAPIRDRCASSVKRYTPQAVLIANVEEARYRALAAEDGLLLVEAHYAVRNNQRSFLKITLPPRRHDLERVGGRQAGPAGRRRGRRRAARAREGPRRRGRADASPCASPTCSPSIRGSTERRRASRSCRRSIFRCRAPASSCTHSPRFRVSRAARRVSRRVRSEACSPKRCARAQVASRRGGCACSTMAPPAPPGRGLHAPPAGAKRSDVAIPAC